MAFGRLKVYTHLRPIDDPLFSKRVVGSDLCFQKATVSFVKASGETRRLSFRRGRINVVALLEAVSTRNPVRCPHRYLPIEWA